MIYPASFEEKIGFDLVRSFVTQECISNMGKERVEKMQYSDSFHQLTKWLEQTEEFRSILLFESPFPAQDFHDLRDIFSRIHIEGTFVEIEELALLRGFINAVTQIVTYIKIRNEEGKFSQLWDICKDIEPEKELLASINKILDAKGSLRDNASEELQRIKKEIIKISGEADRKIRKLLTAAKKEGFVKEDAEMTIRNGRLCIPVPAQFKRKLHGFIHDESATGQTVFIEPAEVFDANNELKDLLNAERREIIRILTAVTNEIRPSIPKLGREHDFIGKIDFIRAKAKFALKINGIKPNLLNNKQINWQKAVHPLLFLNFQGTGKTVQPLNIELQESARILLISGPNAGGKSVCLKTVGLLQYMMQCGLLVSMQESSDMGIFSDFFIAMGDEQSIDSDLSTYSSHLKNLKAMIEHLNASSLFLIDEFGSGTEPTLGGAMAEAILENIYQKRSFGIITTHYGNLKMFPDTHPEAVNGAMLFDTQALKPLFILKIGKPGSSFTYEIAKQIGLPEEVITNAIQKSGTAQIDYEKKLEEIEIEKLEIEKVHKMVNVADEQLATLIREYHDKYTGLEKQRREILQKAKTQAAAIIEGANKVIEKTIREIKENNADKLKTKEARQNIETFKTEIRKEETADKKEALKPVLPVKKPVEKPVPEEKAIQVGDSVFMIDIETVGEVTAINHDEITVSFHSISFKTSLEKVEKISKKEAKTIQKKGVKYDGGSFSEALNRKVANFNSTLDLRGQRADEAITELEAYIDEALLLSIHEVRILHGKGNGVLRNVVRQSLSKRKEVLSARDEVLELGGYGITVVEL